MVVLNMSECRVCSQCRGLMVLEDQGEFLETLDVMSLFEYRCRTCGHLERSETGSIHKKTKDRLHDGGTTRRRWSESDPTVTRRPVQSDSRELLRAETFPVK